VRSARSDVIEVGGASSYPRVLPTMSRIQLDHLVEGIVGESSIEAFRNSAKDRFGDQIWRGESGSNVVRKRRDFVIAAVMTAIVEQAQGGRLARCSSDHDVAAQSQTGHSRTVSPVFSINSN
jgi:hypothetical protein